MLRPPAPGREPLGGGEFETHLKLECLQIIGSFKARGAMSKLTSLDQAAIDPGLITASGGNHGLAVAYAGWAAKVAIKRVSVRPALGAATPFPAVLFQRPVVRAVGVDCGPPALASLSGILML